MLHINQPSTVKSLFNPHPHKPHLASSSSPIHIILYPSPRTLYPTSAPRIHTLYTYTLRLATPSLPEFAINRFLPYSPHNTTRASLCVLITDSRSEPKLLLLQLRSANSIGAVAAREDISFRGCTRCGGSAALRVL